MSPAQALVSKPSGKPVMHSTCTVNVMVVAVLLVVVAVVVRMVL